VEIPPTELPSDEKAVVRTDPMSLEAQSIWQREAETISERYASWCRVYLIQLFMPWCKISDCSTVAKCYMLPGQYIQIYFCSQL